MIKYQVNKTLRVSQFRQLLIGSGLGSRRPVHDQQCLQGMLDNCNLLVSAWHKDELIGVARSLTDFHYACYLSDLAVDKRWQREGIGLELQKLTQQQLEPECKMILLAAPDANSYYQKIGYTHNPRAWVLERDNTLGKK